jgi:hypothetical protein
MSNDSPANHLTGDSYLVWERASEFIADAAARFGRTGFLDARHLERAGDVRAHMADELHIVDDLRSLSDDETAAELGALRTRLTDIHDRVIDAEAIMLRGLSRADAASYRQDEGTETAARRPSGLPRDRST